MTAPRAFLLGIVPLLLCGGALAATRLVRAFPHETHERLFPVCEGCHAGVRSGDDADAYPAVADCALCHDDVREPRVAWQPPGPQPTNLEFSHATHYERTAQAGADAVCQTCHAKAGGAGRMSVGPAEPDRCLECHAHRAETHLAETVECVRCHVPLTDAASLPLDRVARFPTPPSHASTDFISTHGPAAQSERVSCSVCHARESCERCHANADRLAPIAALPRDARVAALASGRLAVYPRPMTHDAEWSLSHGATARTDIASCANCHTQPRCTACHKAAAGDARAVIAALPESGPPTAPASQAPSTTRVHAADIVSAHGRAAASGSLECTQCHAQSECASCHAGAESRAFHASNFVERHAMDAFAGGSACQSCHTTETFCRSCHEKSGLSSAGMTAAFHDAQPMWVLAHGQAARTSMEMCASCHRQTDCVRCHSATGGWGVNPHRRGFPASRLAARSGQTCSYCHIGDPGGGN